MIFDFDGVFTDNGVWIREDGVEFVRCDRSDGLGIAKLRSVGMPVLILSTETNPVVSARGKKLGVPVIQGVPDKGARLVELLRERSIDPLHVAYVGNDVNDADCLKIVGTSVVVQDAHPDVLALADCVLAHSGGHGAVREFCDLVVASVTAVESFASDSAIRAGE